MINCCFKFFFSLISLLFFLLACQQEDKSITKSGLVLASDAYLENFGSPPQGKAGKAFAKVGYLPLKSNPEKFGVSPIFLFTEDDQIKKVLDKLVSGDLSFSDRLPFYNPFPKDTIIEVKSTEGEQITVNIITENLIDSIDQLYAARSLAETALQFEEIKTVDVLFNGQPLPQFPSKGYRHDPKRLSPVHPPLLILMVGNWEKGHDSPEEILVEFDRPVSVNNFALFHEDGTKVEGDYYKSVFQMAVVIHPRNPEKFYQGTLLRAEWEVVDELGRSNQGVDVMALVKHVH